MVTYPSFWLDKPYYSLDAYCKASFGHKCYKIALDAGMTCPNRDGTLDTRGCIFCSAGGSGDFAVKTRGKDIPTQLKEGLSLMSHKNTGQHYIAYFQAYTNTYAPVSYLEQIYRQALSDSHICGISIATRPDCLGADVLSLLRELKASYPDKFLWVELGLQTIKEETALLIRRGYPLSCFEQALVSLKELGIPVIVHVILGLPRESREDMYATIRYLNDCHPFGVKLQLLHVLRGTDLLSLYENGSLKVLSMEEYLQILIHCLELLDPGIVVHRVTGDGPKSLTVAPVWSLNKRNVLNTLHRQMKEQGSFQGKLFNL